MQSETKTPLGSIPRCEFNRKLLRVDRVTLTPPANVTLRNALLLGTLNYLLIDAAFNLEIDVCFIVLIGGYDIVVSTGGFPEEQFCPPVRRANQPDAVRNQFAGQHMENQTSVEDRFARKFSGQARKM